MRRTVGTSVGLPEDVVHDPQGPHASLQTVDVVTVRQCQGTQGEHHTTHQDIPRVHRRTHLCCPSDLPLGPPIVTGEAHPMARRLPTTKAFAKKGSSLMVTALGGDHDGQEDHTWV